MGSNAFRMCFVALHHADPIQGRHVNIIFVFTGQFCQGGHHESAEFSFDLLRQMAGWFWGLEVSHVSSLALLHRCSKQHLQFSPHLVLLPFQHELFPCLLDFTLKCCFFVLRIESIDKMESDFKNCHMFLVTILNKAVCRGSFPHCKSITNKTCCQYCIYIVMLTLNLYLRKPYDLILNLSFCVLSQWSLWHCR